MFEGFKEEFIRDRVVVQQSVNTANSKLDVEGPRHFSSSFILPMIQLQNISPTF